MASQPRPSPLPTSPLTGVRVHRATYRRPFQMHASLGPSAALALWQDDRLTVWSHTQAPFVLRGALAQVLDVEADAIRVMHAEGAGCYGHNGADDAALDAALIARALPDRPIMLKWSRADEHAWEPYGSAMVIELAAQLSPSADILQWQGDIWSYAHSSRPAVGFVTSGLLGALHLKKPFAPQQPRPMGGYHAGAHRNADPIYDLPRKSASSATPSQIARCAFPPCAAWAHTRISLPSSHSWTSWPPTPIKILWISACAI